MICNPTILTRSISQRLREHAHSVPSTTPCNPITPSTAPWSPCCFELMSNIDVCPYPAALVPVPCKWIILFRHRNCWTSKLPINGVPNCHIIEMQTHSPLPSAYKWRGAAGLQVLNTSFLLYKCCCVFLSFPALQKGIPSVPFDLQQKLRTSI